jgi:hypothetical protein
MVISISSQENLLTAGSMILMASQDSRTATGRREDDSLAQRSAKLVEKQLNVNVLASKVNTDAGTHLWTDHYGLSSSPLAVLYDGKGR